MILASPTALYITPELISQESLFLVSVHSCHDENTTVPILRTETKHSNLKTVPTKCFYKC